MPPSRTLIIFARAPEPGRVKTRLAADIGDAAALAAYRELGARVAAGISPIADCETVVAYTPAGREGEGAVRAWLGAAWDAAGPPRALGYVAQGDGDLGARMAGAIDACAAAGAARVVVVGTDCPTVDAAAVEEAFARLDAADVVLGPAADGGYWLVGVRRPTRAIFDGVPWSTPRTLAVTLQRARDAGLAVALLAERRDVDTADDWRDYVAGRLG